MCQAKRCETSSRFRCLHSATARLAGLGVTVCLTAACEKQAQTPTTPTPPTQPLFEIAGLVHESAPTEDVAIAGARVAIVGGALDGLVVITDARGRFSLRPIASSAHTLKVRQDGYQDVELDVAMLPRDGRADIAMLPTPGQLSYRITGFNVCLEHPRDPFFGGRTMAEAAVHLDGVATLGPGDWPFSIGIGSVVYSISPTGQPVRLPNWFSDHRVLGGHRYYFVAYGDAEFCWFLTEPYVISITHPR